MAQMQLPVCGIFVILLGCVANSAEGKLPRLNCFIPSRYHDKVYSLEDKGDRENIPHTHPIP